MYRSREKKSYLRLNLSLELSQYQENTDAI